MSRIRNSDLITLFSPQGRLYQCEYADKGTKEANGSVVVLCNGRTCVVGESIKPVSKLEDTSSTTNVHKINSTIMVAMHGEPADALSGLYKIKEIAAEFEYKNGFPITAKYLAEKVADYNNLSTIYLYKRPLRYYALIFETNKHGAELYRIRGFDGVEQQRHGDWHSPLYKDQARVAAEKHWNSKMIENATEEDLQNMVLQMLRVCNNVRSLEDEGFRMGMTTPAGYRLLTSEEIEACRDRVESLAPLTGILDT